VSREIRINRADIYDVASEETPDDVRFQIGVRLQLHEIKPPGGSSGPNDGSTSEELQRLAGGIYDARRKRDKILSGELFGEPAWDMLLALYCFPGRGEALAVTGLSYAANVAESTGHRIQAELARSGLIERTRDRSDKRRQFVALTVKGRALLERYLGSLLSSDRSFSDRLSVAGL